ncbi:MULTISPECIES: transporter substrate-binding domain-containing protein [unclassified Acinetobacter]|uniref:transporter substrate-binding domain-containing protein n=1 Tax=unclassified Acinetobacter TaxID=196816 RepID=UPI0035BAABF7
MMKYSLYASMLMTTLLVGCGGDNAAKSDAAASGTSAAGAAPSGEVIRIATEGAYAPFNLTNADGSLGGFDVDLVNALCKQMQAKCEVKAQDWDGIIPALKAGKYDVIIAGMSITPERQQVLDFSDPYYDNTLVFVAKSDSNFDPKNPADIDGKPIGAQRSTIASQWLEKNHPKAQSKFYDTSDNAFLELGNSRLNAVISDKAPAMTWLSTDKGKGFNVKGQEINIDDHLGIAFEKGSPLKDRFNKALGELKASGEYQKIADKYFAVPSANTATATAPASAATAPASATASAAQ